MTSPVDPELAEQLQSLDTPDHGPTFWDELDATLAEAGAPATPGSRWGRRPQRLLLVAAVLVIAVGGLGLMWGQLGGEQLDTAGPADDPASLTPTEESGPTGDGNGDVARAVGPSEELSSLAPPAEAFGPGWDQSLFDILPPEVVLLDPAEEPEAACGVTEPIVVPSGYYVEYGFDGIPDDGNAVLAEGPPAQIGRLYAGLVVLARCNATGFDQSPASIEGAEVAVTYEKVDDLGQHSQGIIVDYGDRLLSVTVMIQDGAELLDLEQIVNDLPE